MWKIKGDTYSFVLDRKQVIFIYKHEGKWFGNVLGYDGKISGKEPKAVIIDSIIAAKSCGWI